MLQMLLQNLIVIQLGTKYPICVEPVLIIHKRIPLEQISCSPVHSSCLLSSRHVLMASLHKHLGLPLSNSHNNLIFISHLSLLRHLHTVTPTVLILL